MSEVFRFGILVDFDLVLYFVIYRRYYDVLRVGRELELKWNKNVCKNFVIERYLFILVLIYIDDDMMVRGGLKIMDFSLIERFIILLVLLVLLWKYFVGWLIYKMVYILFIFIDLVIKRLDEEVYDVSFK